MAKRKTGLTPKTSRLLLEYAEKKAKFHAINNMIENSGPLYVRAVVPSYAKRDFDNGQYSAWYIGHLDYAFLEQEQVESYVGEYGEPLDDVDGLSGFMAFLKTKDYIVFHSAHDEGVIVLDAGDL